MIYYAILIVAHTPRVIAEADTTDELVEKLHDSMPIDAVVAEVITRACSRARGLNPRTRRRSAPIERVSQCELPLSNGGRLFVQYQSEEV